MSEFPFTRSQLETCLYAIRQTLARNQKRESKDLLDKLKEAEKKLSDLLK
jgi:hypothetical protein